MPHRGPLPQIGPLSLTEALSLNPSAQGCRISIVYEDEGLSCDEAVERCEDHHQLSVRGQGPDVERRWG